jgi:hypothetical protein
MEGPVQKDLADAAGGAMGDTIPAKWFWRGPRAPGPGPRATGHGSRATGLSWPGPSPAVVGGVPGDYMNISNRS